MKGLAIQEEGSLHLFMNKQAPVGSLFIIVIVYLIENNLFL